MRVEKILALLLLLSATFVAGDYIIRTHVVLPGFAELESQEAAKDIARCRNAVTREISHLTKLATDWAVWDDLYQFAADGNATFVTSNFQWPTLADSGIHLMSVIDTGGRVVYQGAIDSLTRESITSPQLPADAFPADHALLKIPDGAISSSGVFLTKAGPLLLVSHRILTSVGEGPSRGTLLVGRFLDAAMLADLRQQTQIEFAVRDPVTAPFSAGENRHIGELAAGRQVSEVVDDATLQAFGLIEDLEGRPGLLLTATLPRHIMARGRTTARFSSMVVLQAVALIIFASIALTLLLIVKSRRRQKEIEALVEQRTDELRLSEERLHALSDASFEAVFLTEKGICLEQNRAAEKMFGYSSLEAIGRHANMWIAPEDRQLVIDKVLEREEKPYEVKALTKDGRIFPAQLQTREAEYRGRRIRITALRDLTLEKQAEKERRLMEDKLRRSQKMESIGLLAGGVAHDLNNILSGIVTYPELILMNLAEDSPLYQPIAAIGKSGKSAAAVVDDLLTLARGVSCGRDTDSLNAIVTEYTDSPEFQSLKALHGHVTFRLELEPQLLNISCSPIHIKKCVMNLMTNGAEAVSSEGQVTVATRNQYCEAPLPGYPEMRQGEYAVLSVADTGVGIPEENLDRIFEPFYSRKVVGRSGTGLGLAVTWNTVNDHRGGITVKSGGAGTVFELYFPATRDNLMTRPELVDLAQFQGNGEKVLVVDDDSEQRRIAIQLLDRLNYRGQAVGSGEEALLHLGRDKADLVILDMVMTGMNGCETYRRILDLHPRQKAIVTSGYSESCDVREALAIGVHRFIKKPYPVATLAAAIQDTLKNRPDTLTP